MPLGADRRDDRSSSLRIPNATSATSAVPEPSFPYRPTTSPFPIVRSRSWNALPDEADSNVSNVSVGSASSGAGRSTAPTALPTIAVDEIIAREVRDEALEHRRAVAQDLHAVRDLDDLVETVRDVDDRDAALAQTAA